jgi:general secretion pathway protein H
MSCKHLQGMRFGERGFTLIELIVVLAVISLVLGIAVPRLGRGSDSHAAAATAHAVAAALRLSRNRAVAEARPTRFVVDAGSYGPGGAGHLSPVPQGISLTLIDSGRIDAARHADAIRFYPDGSSTGGGVALTAGTVRYDVLVDWLNGNVSIQPQSAPPRR